MKSDGFVKSRIIPFIWIPVFAGMTIKLLISSVYAIRHTREGGYPVSKMTFYDFIKSGYPIATLDTKLIQAARKIDVKIVPG
jgi:hypothetical protein